MSPRRHQQRTRVALFATMAALTVGAALLISPIATGETSTVSLSPVPSPFRTAPEETEGLTAPAPDPSGPGCVGSVNPELCPIEHVIFIVQENRSFDHYFGVYKNPNDMKVAGIPRKPSGGFAKSNCNPHPVLNKCLMPYRTTNDINIGGPHGRDASVRAVNGGKMNGFIEAAATSPHSRTCVQNPTRTSCKPYVGPKLQPDLMSYRIREDIPNYWALADWGVLQDHLFASVDSYSLPAHHFIFSGWAATCTSGPMSCVSDATPAPSNFAWTPIAYLLDEHGVDWKWYTGEDTNNCLNYPNCPQDKGDDFSPPNWNVAPGFTYVQEVSGLNQHVKPVSDFHDDLANGTLPEVTWLIPGERDSEHPGKGTMAPGHKYVSDLVEEIGASQYWDNVAVWIYWDDWGGFYDHMRPLKVDKLGYGIRVPGIMISPYAKEGWVDHQVHSFDSFLKFVEDRFLSGERLDPDTLGRPDSRKNVRENEDILGDLTAEFDFTQEPRDPPVLPE